MLHEFARRMRAPLVALVVAFAAVACGSSALDGAGQAAADATIGFASPSNGATVGLPFDVQLAASVPLGEPETGNHHAHLYFDTGTDATDYDIVYGTSWQVTRQLAPGPHEITVALANPDHSLAGPTQTISVTVGEGGEAPAAPAESPSGGGPASDPGPLY